MFLLLLILCGFIIYKIFRYYRWVRKFPRGPFPLPFVGNYYQLSGDKMCLELEKYSKEYGSMFTVFLPVPVVVLADYETVRQAFVVQGEEFSDRPKDALADEIFAYCENGGIIAATGDAWREQRRTALNILRDFGMGRNVMEEKIKASIANYLKYLDELSDKDHVDMQWPLQITISNIINEMLFGFCYDFDDAEPLMNFLESFKKFMMEVNGSPLLLIAMKFPFIKHIPILGYHAVWKHKEIVSKIKQYIVDAADKAMDSFDPDGEPECFVHAYKQRAADNEHLTHPQLLSICNDFFVAGQESTSNTLRWAMLFMADNISVQEKVREEIFSVVGRNRLPSMADRRQMPFTAATILEVQRKANIVGMNVSHYVSKEVRLKGMTIPVGALVNGDLHNILANDPIFEDGDRFQPERFLSDDGKSLNKETVDHCVPFSMGRRQCAGEALARVELFLGITSTLQRYAILPCPDCPVDLDPVYGSIITPKKNLLRLVQLD